MNGETFRGDERAVSPVVGVALLIAMTVILAAVIAMVVLGLGAGMAEAPQATLTFEDDGGDLVITHDGGDALDPDDVGYNNGSGFTSLTAGPGSINGDALTAGESYTIDGAAADEVRIVWQDPNSDSESVIGTYRP